jgi:hypothetical protein
MRRTGLLIGGWALATVLALVLGLQGVRSVSDSVTGHRPAPLSASSVKAALQSAGPQPPPTSTTESLPVEPPPSSAFSSAVANSSSSSPSSSASNPGPAPDTESSGSHGNDDEASSSDNHTSPRQDATYQLVGGTVGVRFENGGAHLLWATPNSGFTAQNRSGASAVDVRFRSDNHESRLRAFWDGGPQNEIEEKD